MLADPAPGQSLFLETRISFIRKGSTLHAWCKKNAVRPSDARQALIGTWNGPKGRAMRTRVLKAAGLLQ